jgi:acyl-homoserine lactone acylase PvdQ
MSRRVLPACAAALLTAALLVFPGQRPAAAAVLTGNDYCLDQCNDIVPPGENGNATLADILAHKALGTRPAHSADQLGPYANLVSAYSGLTDDQITTFYNDSSFGVPAGQVERTEQPRADVTIVRDKATGVPHVTGTTREGTMFGAGFAGAEDRLFVMDLLRRVGRGQLTSFAGGAPGNRELEQSVWRNSPYTEADLQAQVDRLRTEGSRGVQLYADVQQYIAGINAYIAQCMSARNCPGEYVLTGHLDAITNAGGPEQFTMTDLIAIAGVVGGLFGGGGGGEMRSALVRIAARAKYGATVGDQVWQAFREQNDPESVTTVHNGQSFPYGDASPDAPGVAMPDAGTATPEPLVYNPTGSAAGTAQVAPGAPHKGMSNAVVISAAHSSTGHPIAVFGPQTGYFSPQLLMLQELQGPGISARGVAFAGLNLYVLIGRGQDYAWSATSSSQDITDTYSVPLCQDDQHYLYHGQCLAMEVLQRDNSWNPTLADSTAAGSYQLKALRTKYGLVTWRGKVNGQAVAFTELRSTYRHEADSAIGFQMFDDPAAMGTPAAFTDSASHVGYAFNWFYVNSTDTAYFNSGLNPVRRPGANPNLPTRADPAYEWQNWNPDTNVADYTPAATHPQAVDQDYFVSWNNKQAPGFGAADGNFSFGSVQRAELLDARVKQAIAGGAKLDRAGTVRLVEDAAVTDLRGEAELGLLLRVLTSQPITDPALAATVGQLQAWQQAGAKRIETAPGSKVDQHADAIRVFDAWWPRLVTAAFQNGLGPDLFQALVNALQINESPSGGQNGTTTNLPSSANESQSHKGSSFQFGWWGYLDKDLRTLLGDPVQGGLGRVYCGGGSLGACRTALLDALSAAAAEPATTTYPGDATCAAGDQWCADSIIQSPLGGITDTPISWQNRPTFQQVVSFPAHRGDDLSNLAQGRSVKANSTLIGFSAGAAVDGDPTSRWSSWWTDNQSITVDLGGSRGVGRVILRWDSAYGSAYRVDVSDDNSTWRTVATVTAGNGGTDNLTFPATSARYVRMAGVHRATAFGYMLLEFEVYAR